MVPLQMGVPGGAEVLVILLVSVLLFGVPLVLLVGGGFLYLRSKGNREDRIDELEREVEHLKAELDDQADNGGSATGDDRGATAGDR